MLTYLNKRELITLLEKLPDGIPIGIYDSHQYVRLITEADVVTVAPSKEAGVYVVPSIGVAKDQLLPVIMIA